MLLDLGYLLPLYPFHFQLELGPFTLLFLCGLLLRLAVDLLSLLFEFNNSFLEMIFSFRVNSLSLGQLFLVHLLDQLQTVVVFVLLLGEPRRFQCFLLSLFKLLSERVHLLFMVCKRLFLDGLEFFEELRLQSLSDSVLCVLNVESLLLL